MKYLLLILYLIFETKNVFGFSGITCKPRLIIGSGENVNNFNSFARKPTDCDVTIDKNKKLNPSYVADIKKENSFYDISIKHPNQFNQIIFEHVGEGLASLVTNKAELEQFLLSCKHVLTKDGIIIYESYSKTSYCADDYGNEIDFGISQVIDKHYQALDAIYNENKLTLLNQKFAFIKTKYEELFAKNGFDIITFLIKKDENYRQIKPSKTPYYYLAVTIKTK